MMPTDSFLIPFGIIFALLLGWYFVDQWRWNKRHKKAEKLNVIRYGVLEHRKYSGARTWLTPFDLKQAHEAFHEAVWGMQRDDEVEYCTIFLTKNGGEPQPLWTVGQAPADTLKAKQN